MRYAGGDTEVLDKVKIKDVIKRNFGKSVSAFCKENLKKNQSYLGHIFSPKESGGLGGEVSTDIAAWLAIKLRVGIDDICTETKNKTLVQSQMKRLLQYPKKEPATPVWDSERQGYFLRDEDLKEDVETDMSKLADEVHRLYLQQYETNKLLTKLYNLLRFGKEGR